MGFRNSAMGIRNERIAKCNRIIASFGKMDFVALCSRDTLKGE